jgi:N-acetylglucosaminyldiphosphoundecaprenol N-acetyl-beta-D-mannosaminyltransferase
VKHVSILGVDIAAQSFEEALSALLRAAAARERVRAHFCTVHSVVEAARNTELTKVFNTAELAFTDGMPLVWVSRLKGARGAERVCGPDVLPALADRGRRPGLRHYFLGGAPGTPEALAASLANRFPGLVVAGTHSPPFRAMSADEDAVMMAAINEAEPDVVWIGLGSPKQEFWAARLADRVNAPLILPVGAAFDFHSGRLRRAPRWMHRVGLEWLFRLVMEPRRLWRRYLVTNARFAWLVLREQLSPRARRQRGKG